MRLNGGRLPEKPCFRRLVRRWGLRVKDGWRLERYNCPRFTAPDEQGRVVLDWAVDVEAPKGE